MSEKIKEARKAEGFPSSVDSTMKVPTHDLPSYPQTLENTGVCPYFFVAKFFLL